MKGQNKGLGNGHICKYTLVRPDKGNQGTGTTQKTGQQDTGKNLSQIGKTNEGGTDNQKCRDTADILGKTLST